MRVKQHGKGPCDSTKGEKQRWIDSRISREETRSKRRRRGVPTRNRKAA